MNTIENNRILSLFHIAVVTDNEILAKQYFEKYFPRVNTRNLSLRCAPLHYAVSNGNYLVADILLRHGARVNEPNDSLLTPLHIAVSNRSRTMVNLLLRHHAQVNPEQNFQGKTPLFMAVEYGSVNIARTLLMRGASVIKASLRGTTLIHVAVRLGLTEMAELLLQFSPVELLSEKSNIEGKTAMELAWELERYKIVDLLDQKISYGYLLPKWSKAPRPYPEVVDNKFTKRKDLKKKPVMLLLRNGRKIPLPNILFGRR